MKIRKLDLPKDPPFVEVVLTERELELLVAALGVATTTSMDRLLIRHHADPVEEGPVSPSGLYGELGRTLGWTA